MVPADVPTRARAPVVTHAKLPIRNPFIGSFSHAPPSSTAYCRFFNNAVTSSVEYQRQKSFKCVCGVGGGEHRANLRLPCVPRTRAPCLVPAPSAPKCTLQ